MTKREFQAAESKEKLLRSAAGLFSQKGYRATSVREINRSIDMADGLLYHYFPGGKKEIFLKVYEQSMSKTLKSFKEKRNQEDYIELPIVQMLETIYQDFMGIVNENIDAIRTILREEEIQDEIMKENDFWSICGSEEWLVELLKIKFRSGEIREMDFECAASLILQLLRNLIVGTAFGFINEDMMDMRYRYFEYLAFLWRPEAGNK
ncbi:MAG: TetR/AcrR family transcriptional regulator [Lachnospiraceae bacterium]|nr:TetR/AcrR family transcriptional regulator [Lachnospiraceae bacterium]